MEFWQMLTRRVYSTITLPMEKSKFNIDYRKSEYDFFVTHKYGDKYVIFFTFTNDIRFVNLHCSPVNTVLKDELQISCFYKGLEEFKV